MLDAGRQQQSETTGEPDTHSPAWDWQYVIRDPKVGERYGYRARVVIKPFKSTEQVWEEYQKWRKDVEAVLPACPVTERP